MMQSESYIHPAIRVGKRGFDILGAVIGIAFLLPILPLIGLAIRLESPGPVFFHQLRIGRSTRDRTELFQMVKFRTMRRDAEAGTGPQWATENDPRVTRVGRVLRNTRLDELPQFLNVLKGEMSLIGPRPERPGIFGKLENAIPFYAERAYGVQPGITGLAQINQGYDRNLDDVRSKLAYDHAYALALSKPRTWLKTDLGIVFRTVFMMAAGRGQ